MFVNRFKLVESMSLEMVTVRGRHVTVDTDAIRTETVRVHRLTDCPY